ncbi:MAG TPA: hypothetical protein DIW51_08930 [Rhodospirillaceae bacterium]|nr:hypothetical protein [Magnetovibrio sp.]HBT44317.1 hypothetical protein [Rhodospirillaceae bacterium]HCS70078.1 hypothetical protein [Rhodospirillaceae bacterium]|tara:strand:- start:403 stop:705 length:303 start_codon:yes stop_codon:yes gene_type:complete
MTKAADWMKEHIRLAILETIDQDPGHSCNHVIIAHALERGRAISLTDEQVKEHLEWLAGRDLVMTEQVGRYRIARLTEDGERAARGLKVVEGIARPDPRD